MDKRFVGIVELAKYLDVSIKTIRHWVFTKHIPYFKMGRLVKFDLREIETWTKESKVDVIK